MWSGRIVVLASCLVARSASAHPSPAEPPAFFPDDCIVVIDKRAQTSWHLDYAVITDDTAPEVDHVSLADSKTHQFFALSGTLFERAMSYEIVLFDDEEGRVRAMPTWLDAGDVMRTAAGVTPEDMTSFTADQVLAGDILANDPVLSSAVRPLLPGTARAPITSERATAGVTWDLTDVPPGVYQIAAYIFSPPYNGWAARPGLIKVVDGTAEPPAVTLEPIAGRVFAGQGRRTRGCVHAPEGSTLEVSTRAQAEVASAFEPWITQPADNGMFEVCLDNAGRNAALEVRVAVRAPSGAFTAMQSSDAVSLFSNEAACVASELLCCPAAGEADAGATADAAVPMTPIDRVPAVDAGEPNHGTVVPPAQGPSGDAGGSAPTLADSAEASGGCAVSDRPSRGSVAVVALLISLLTALWSRHGFGKHDAAHLSARRTARARAGERSV